MNLYIFIIFISYTPIYTDRAPISLYFFSCSSVHKQIVVTTQGALSSYLTTLSLLCILVQGELNNPNGIMPLLSWAAFPCTSLSEFIVSFSSLFSHLLQLNSYSHIVALPFAFAAVVLRCRVCSPYAFAIWAILPTTHTHSHTHRHMQIHLYLCSWIHEKVFTILHLLQFLLLLRPSICSLLSFSHSAFPSFHLSLFFCFFFCQFHALFVRFGICLCLLFDLVFVFVFVSFRVFFFGAIFDIFVLLTNLRRTMQTNKH